MTTITRGPASFARKRNCWEGWFGIGSDHYTQCQACGEALTRLTSGAEMCLLGTNAASPPTEFPAGCRYMAYQAQILLADDEDNFRESIVSLFKKAGYGCDDVADAHEALAAIKQKHYDLLVADIRMPGNPDLELVRKATEYNQTLPVIVITGHPSLDSAISSVGLPVSAYLVKPFAFEELLTETRSAIKSGMVYRGVDAALKDVTDWRDELTQLKKRDEEWGAEFVGRAPCRYHASAY